jgi:hypothetical protein
MAALGTWGSPASGAQNTSSLLQGPGILLVAVPSADSPIISVPYFAGTNLVLVAGNTMSGASYILESTPSLSAPITWTPVLTNISTGSTMTNELPVTPDEPQQFFRYQGQ